MRIPPSVIVMSLLTAVPFGLGIRETLAMKDAPTEDEAVDELLDYSAKQRELVAKKEAERAREAAEREANSNLRAARFDQLFGAKSATMGSLLEGIVLGADAGSFQPEHARERIAAATRDGFLDVAFDVDATSLNAVTISVHDDESSDACDKLESKLEAAWGPSTRGAWLHVDTKQRAVFDSDNCQLRFDRFLPTNEWVDALPINLIGAHVDKLTARVRGSVTGVADDFVTWHLPGVRYGKDATKLEAYVENNKVLGIKAMFDTDLDSATLLRDFLSTKLKAEAERDEDTGAWTWKSRTPATLEEIATNRYSLVIGKF